jgi:hypothetical protein
MAANAANPFTEVPVSNNRRMYSLVAFSVLVGGSMFSHARMGISDGRLIPYSGTLRSNGAVANGVYDMRFGLFTTEPTGVGQPACLLTNPAACSPWGEEQQVTVSSGQFSVELGDSIAITDADISADALYLAIAVRGPSDASFALVGSHELIPVPWAARAATSTNYEVTNALTVGGTARVTGALTAQSTATVGGALTAQSNASVAGTLGVGGSTTLTQATINGSSPSKLVLSGTSDLDIHYAGTTTWEVGTNWAAASGGANAFYWYAAGQKMALDASGNLHVSGNVLRDEYSASCAEGLSGVHFSYCCRINKRTGVASCKRDDGTTTGGTWSNMSSPFGSTGSDPPYDITCNTHVSGINFPICCRIGASGGMDCAYNGTPSIDGAWTATGNPF